MEEKHTDDDTLSEARLIELLSQLSKEPTSEAHFEERFLSVFHERVMQEAVCKSARTRLWEHLSCFFSAAHKGKLAFASMSILAFGAFTLMLSNWAVNSDSATATANRDRVKRGVIESFDSLSVNSSLFKPQEKHSKLDIEVSPVDEEDEVYKKILLYDNESDAFYCVELDDANVVDGMELLHFGS